MKATICEYCLIVIEKDSHTLIVDGLDGDDHPKKEDICDVCFHSPIILSERRRTRTRKPKPKVGRPRKERIGDLLFNAGTSKAKGKKTVAHTIDQKPIDDPGDPGGGV